MITPGKAARAAKPPQKMVFVSTGEKPIIAPYLSNQRSTPMLKKAFIIIIALCAFGSLGGVFLAGLNIYTRSTTPQETNSQAPSLLPMPSQQDQQ